MPTGKEMNPKRITLLMKTRFNGKNGFLSLKACLISAVRYNAAFLHWTIEDAKELDR